MDRKIRLEFGINGIGGNRNSHIGDGFYRIAIDTDEDSTSGDAHFESFRLFGDAGGDGTVNNADAGVVTNPFGQSGFNREGGINGDSFVNILDRLFTLQQSQLGNPSHSDPCNELDD